MDQMMRQLKLLVASRRVLKKEELETVVEYLNGNATLEDAHALLQTVDREKYTHNWQCRELTSDIRSVCRREPELLPRLGRYLLLLNMMNPAIYKEVTANMLEHLSWDQVFVESGLGVDAGLTFITVHDTIHVDRTAVLRKIHEQNPQILEEFVRSRPPLTRLPALAYLCAVRGEDIFTGLPDSLPQLLTHDLLLLTGYAIQSNKSLLPALRVLLPEAHLPEDSDYEKWHKDLDRNLLLAYAFLYSRERLPKVALLARALCQPSNFHLINTCDIVGSHENPALTLEEMLLPLGISRAVICAWQATKSINDYQRNDFIDPAYQKEPALLGEAAELVQPPARILLWRLQYEAGSAQDKSLIERMVIAGIDSFTEKLTALYTKNEKKSGGAAEQFAAKKSSVTPLIDWLVTGTGSVEKINALGAYFKSNNLNDLSLWFLAGLHPAPERYLHYLAAKGHDSAFNFGMVIIKAQIRQPGEIAELLLSSMPPALALTYTFWRNDGVFRYIAKSHPAPLVEMLQKKDAYDTDARSTLLEVLYTEHPDYDPELLIAYLGDSSKKLRQTAIGLLLPKKDLIEKIRPLTEAKKKDLREAAEKLLAAYEGTADSTEESVDVISYCLRYAPKNDAAVKWAFPQELPTIRLADGSPADAKVVSCYLNLTLASKTIELNPAVPQIRSALKEEDLHETARAAFRQWLSLGAPAKTKGAILLYALHADDTEILQLQKQMTEWSDAARGAIAAEAARAMVLGGRDLALMTADDISRRFKNKQVRRAAEEAFAGAAAALGISPEALGDRIIPTLGFDERGEKTIDYGTRTFTAYISPNLSLELKDSQGKVIKSLPKPNAKDDTERAEAAKKDFTALKKSLKAITTTQGQRLEQALATGRHWTRETWENLFIHNPIMHSFAISLIWGVYTSEKLGTTFRFLEDGSFTTAEEEYFVLDGKEEIGLVHPLELEAELLETWKTQLSDYDVTQAIPQLDRKINLITDQEKQADRIERFAGTMMLGITLQTRLLKAGWYRGSVQDAGAFYTFYKEIGTVGAQIYFSGVYVSPDPEDVITVGTACFYKAGAIDRGSYVYDDVSKDTLIRPVDVNPRLFSEIILDLEQATVSDRAKNPDWKKETS